MDAAEIDARVKELQPAVKGVIKSIDMTTITLEDGRVLQIGSVSHWVSDGERKGHEIQVPILEFVK